MRRGGILCGQSPGSQQPGLTGDISQREERQQQKAVSKALHRFLSPARFAGPSRIGDTPNRLTRLLHLQERIQSSHVTAGGFRTDFSRHLSTYAFGPGTHPAPCVRVSKRSPGQQHQSHRSHHGCHAGDHGNFVMCGTINKFHHGVGSTFPGVCRCPVDSITTSPNGSRAVSLGSRPTTRCISIPLPRKPDALDGPVVPHPTAVTSIDLDPTPRLTV